jgi:hypothetical protein
MMKDGQLAEESPEPGEVVWRDDPDDAAAGTGGRGCVPA